jgi:regulatory protein
MAVVASRHPVPGNPAWVTVTWDDGEAFELPVSEWVEYGLAIGREVSEEVRDRLRRRAEQAVFRERCLRWLGRRPRTVAETVAYLRRIGASEDCIEGVTTDLISAGWLDDERYAARWVEAESPRRSLAELRRQLASRGVPRDVVVRALATVRNAGIESEAARRVAEKYWRTHASVAPSERRWRMARYLQQRGFPVSVIRRILEDPGYAAEGDTLDDADAFLDRD